MNNAIILSNTKILQTFIFFFRPAEKRKLSSKVRTCRARETAVTSGWTGRPLTASQRAPACHQSAPHVARPDVGISHSVVMLISTITTDTTTSEVGSCQKWKYGPVLFYISNVLWYLNKYDEDDIFLKLFDNFRNIKRLSHTILFLIEISPVFYLLEATIKYR